MHYPDIDPIAISLGQLSIHWYGITYLAAFLAALFFGRRRARAPGSVLRPAAVSDLIFFGMLGVIVGGRLGYMLFYNFSALIAEPLSLFRIWQGGMSFHGGLIGVLVSCLWLARRERLGYVALMDFVAPLVPLGLGFGRLGNFINTELPGRITEGSWGLYYPCYAVRQISDYCPPDMAGFEPVLRHPSSLYQAFTEGLLLFLALYFISRKPRPTGFVSGCFLVGYGAARCFTELFRNPDAGVGYLSYGLTMGQLLSIPMILCGVGLISYAFLRNNPGEAR